ncbi:hypothetical protein [Cognatiluteimonas profundi]|uniref:hypothetical protein n=1 Tax=Cognatiluteimonas profundi TaxID=2594501 RepID=UPI00131B7406|nr:hypothetical protein [Lysobacter profundi]
MRLLRLPIVLALLPPLVLFGGALRAQETVIQVENVRMDYAQVLQVAPVYQTLTATQIEQQCDGVPVPNPSPKGLSRIVGKIKALGSRSTDAAPTPNRDCRMVPVQRQFRRPIAFDVDYIYKGMKYRSRLPNDPGNRLRVRVSVTPYVAPDKR